MAAREGNLESVSLTAITTAMRGYPWQPKDNPVTLGARFPMFMHWADKEVAGLTIGLAMHRWAMYGGGADLDRVVEPLTGWLLGPADALDADTGHITLDRVSADDGFSPWERAVGFSPGYRDVTDTVWGYGWGTLLGTSHVAALGGIQSLKRLPWARAEQRAGGRVWLTLTREISALGQDAMRPLREILAPVLPVGGRTYQQYLNSPPEPGVLPEVYPLYTPRPLPCPRTRHPASGLAIGRRLSSRWSAPGRTGASRPLQARLGRVRRRRPRRPPWR